MKVQWNVMEKQLNEMRSGGVDTHNLAVAATDQATWTRKLSAGMDTQSDNTKALAEQMKHQADRTKTLADEAVLQAQSAKTSAIAAQSTAESVVASLRPWIKIIDVKPAKSAGECPTFFVKTRN